MKLTHLNPDTMHKNPAFSQGVSVEGSTRTIYVGGQNGVDADGKVVAADLAKQTEQAFKNVLSVLAAAGAAQENVVKLTIHLVQGGAIEQAFGAAQRVWGRHATAISVLQVAALANPQFLVEIDAIAAL